MLTNLLGNAGKYARLKLEVAVIEAITSPDDVSGARAGAASSGTARTTGSYTLVSFANDVERLEEGEVARLLEPFYTADTARSRESTGLGLAISRRLVEQMGGTLCVRREVRADVSWLVVEMVLEGAGWPEDEKRGEGVTPR